jgi:alpha-mannosidase
MIDLRPKWTGEWHLRLHSLDGAEIPCQEEQPECLMPFNWRKKIVFIGDLPQVGASRYELRIHEGTKEQATSPALLRHTTDPQRGLINTLDAGGGRECLAGVLLQPLVAEDDGDSWGADRWNYRTVVGSFQHRPDQRVVVESGPIRTITQSDFIYHHSRIVLYTISYASWPVVEYRLRITWNESRKRLKLSIPTVFKNDAIFCEVPGGSIHRAADGEEHVHGRWCMLEGDINGRRTGFAVINSGQHGFDFKDGEIRLSVLRSAAFCHDRGFKITEPPARKYMDQGIHEIRLLVTAGDADEVRSSLAGLADWLSAPPIVYAHLPIGEKVGQCDEFMTLRPRNIRLLATKRSEDGKALVLRLQEAIGVHTKAKASTVRTKSEFALSFKPFEIKTIRLEKSGRWREVALIEED